MQCVLEGEKKCSGVWEVAVGASQFCGEEAFAALEGFLTSQNPLIFIQLQVFPLLASCME